MGGMHSATMIAHAYAAGLGLDKTLPPSLQLDYSFALEAMTKSVRKVENADGEYSKLGSRVIL